MLISAIHKSAIRFPESASAVVPVLMDFLGDANQASAVEVRFVLYCIFTILHSTVLYCIVLDCVL